MIGDDLKWSFYILLKINKNMNSGKYILAQLFFFIPQRVFDRVVGKYKGNFRVKNFMCWNQMLCVIFGQLSNRDSLRDLILMINAHRIKPTF